MTVAMPDVKSFIGDTGADYDDLLTDCLNQSQALVDKHVGDCVVPMVIRDRAYIEVAADLFHRRNAPNGIMNQQYSSFDGIAGGEAVRIARDPMQAAYKILGRWVLPW